MDSKFDNKAWFDYVNKLNDREISRKSSSGFTLWAILGLLVYLIFSIIDNLPTVLNNTNSLFLTILFIANILNITSVLVMIYSLVSAQNNESQERKLLTSSGNKALRIIVIACIVPFFLSIACNIFIYINSRYYNIIELPYLYFTCYLIFSLLTLLIFILNIRTKTKLPNSPKVEMDFTPVQKGVVQLVLQLVVILTSTTFLYVEVENLFCNILILNNIVLVKFSFLFLGVILCVFFLANRAATELRFSWLADFERRIIVEDLDSETIKELFSKEYIGTPALDWLNQFEKEFLLYLNKVKKELENLDSDIIDFQDETDISYQDAIEIMKLNEQAVEKVTICKDEIEKFIEDKKRSLESFLAYGPINNTEKLFIESFTKKLLTNSHEILEISQIINAKVKKGKEFVDSKKPS